MSRPARFEKQREQRGVRIGHGPRRMSTIEKAKDPRGALKRLLSYLKAYKMQLVAVGLLTTASTLLSLAGPYLIGVTIDRYIIPRNMEGLVRMTMLLVGTYLLSLLADMGASWIMATVSQRSLMKLRGELFEHMQTLSLSFFDKRPAGDLMSRLTNDIDAIGAALTQNVTRLTRNLLTLLGIVVIMFSLNIWVIAFGQQEYANRKFGRANQKVREIGIRATTYAMLIPPLMRVLSNTNIAVVAGVGSWMALLGMTTVGTIAAFIGYSRRYANPLRHFAELYSSIQSALAGAERVFEILDIEPERDHPDAMTVDDFRGEVVFKGVDFSYVPGIQVLKDIDLEAKPGQSIALVGPTGAGKTTIVNVLARFYDIQDGTILIDGMNIKLIKKDSLRRRLGIVLQDVFLFSGTVMENIRQAAKLANADSFIRRLPQGYQTELSEQAENLSQGQRQLLSIARAIVTDPAILILDEATSSVDTRTEMQIQEALHRLMEGRTSFVIAHRLSTIRNADQVLVINNGEIIERGTHEELLEKQGFYYNLYMNQFKGTYVDTLDTRGKLPPRSTSSISSSTTRHVQRSEVMSGGDD